MGGANYAKGVAYLFRNRDISHSANSRYLDALALVSTNSGDGADEILHGYAAVYIDVQLIENKVYWVGGCQRSIG